MLTDKKEQQTEQCCLCTYVQLEEKSEDIKGVKGLS
jgi:hypothetical protein